MNKVQVVHLVEDLKTGGLERVIADITERIDKSRFNITVWCLVKGGAVFDELKAKGFEVRIVAMKSHRDPGFYVRLIKELKKNNTHIVHTHGISANTVGRIAAILARVPVIICHMHSNYVSYTLKNKITDRVLSYFTDKIVCCSKAVAEFVIKTEGIKPEKVDIIYNGVDCDKFCKPKTVKKEEFVIGCVASLQVHKGHIYFLEAAKKVLDSTDRKIRFIIAGDGPLMPVLKQKTRDLGIDSFVDFKGNVIDTASLISDFDIAVLASWQREGLGLALIEAMALFKPCIGCNTGGIPEVIEDKRNGLLVRPKDSEALAAAIVYMLNNPEDLVAMAIKARAIAVRKFSLSMMIANIENLYEKLYPVKCRYNILFISSFSSLQGGGQRSTYLLMKYLNKEMFCPHVIVPDKGEFSKEAERLGIKVFIFDFIRIKSFNIISIVSTLFKLRRLLRQEKIDLIHTESPRQNIYAGFLGKILGVPVVMHLRTSDHLYWLDRLIYYFSDVLIAVSCEVKDRFKSIDKKAKVKVVHNGVELDAYKLGQERIGGDFLRCGYFGRIEPRKGVDVLIKAVKRLKEPVRTLIMGSGPAEYVDELKILAAGTGIEFREYKSNIIDDMAGMDVIVFPPIRGEGLSRVIIESMAMGKIVVASDWPSNREALGQTAEGFIFPVGDDEKLSAILSEIVRNKKLIDEKKDSIRKRAEIFFNIKEKTAEIEDVYQTLLSA